MHAETMLSRCRAAAPFWQVLEIELSSSLCLINRARPGHSGRTAKLLTLDDSMHAPTNSSRRPSLHANVLQDGMRSSAATRVRSHRKPSYETKATEYTV